MSVLLLYGFTVIGKLGFTGKWKGYLTDPVSDIQWSMFTWKKKKS